MTANPSDGYILYLWLGVCEERGIAPPKGTSEVLVEWDLCEHLATKDLKCEGYTMPIHLVRRAFEGLPVKQVFGLVSYAQRIPDVEGRDSYLRYRARKREEAA